MSHANQLDPIVSTVWLRDHLDDVLIVDTRAYLDDRDGYTNYLDGHLPSAVFIDLDSVVCGPPGPVVGRHPLPDPSVFVAGLGAAGLGGAGLGAVGIEGLTQVVAYDDLGGMIAARLVWMLRTLGHPASLLDGGIQAWGGPLETGPAQSSTTAQSPDSAQSPEAPALFPGAAIADASDVIAHINNGGVVVDSRAPERYAGEIEPIDPKAGHIPGAINMPFAGNLDDAGLFLDPEKLRERFQANGVDKNSIVYCGSGVSACHNLLAAERAGLGVPRLYVGSWSGWSSDQSRSVATGSKA